MMNDNKRETLMHKIQMYAFTAHECALYLDCHPHNRHALEKHHQATDKMREYVAQYEALYGPLTKENAGEKHWNWVNGKWPWQNKED